MIIYVIFSTLIYVIFSTLNALFPDNKTCLNIDCIEISTQTSGKESQIEIKNLKLENLRLKEEMDVLSNDSKLLVLID